jgi:hypothetical protein
MVARAASAGGALPNVAIAVVSWLISEFFAGCAAYAEAMYPMRPLEHDDAHRKDPVPPVASRPAGVPRPILRVVSGTAGRGAERFEAARQDSRRE